MGSFSLHDTGRKYENSMMVYLGIGLKSRQIEVEKWIVDPGLVEIGKRYAFF